ncbi:16S rRNA (guanine(527)-N(7))-methyltransferase RsmG [Sulfurimonas sp. MAG313]|nr:16S rRNA (guanine(527)-N(7))-methyltransferase RsmG [Sulfurimonas sp. MAG313]MDF1880608.1 16S rRNA (guanine(527)-N(7))-methyltransferase RsmG [Sulfurimonas sp. MAG313]
MDLKAKLEQDKIVLPDTFYEHVERYTQHLLKWNKIHNLTGATNKDLVAEHIYDSVFPVSFLPILKNALDIGTGAGFPGLILAMALPSTKFTLVEPLAKRSGFLQFIKADLGLKNVEVLNKRIEDVAPVAYDFITSRAVTETKTLMDFAQPFISKGTLLLFFKGERVYDEITEAEHIKIIKTDKRHYLLIEQ